MENITWIHFVVLILAAFRLTHLIVYDKITQFIRNPFIRTDVEVDESGQPQQVIHIKGTGLQYWFGSLLSCHWCTGVWCSIAVAVIYLYVPAAFPILVILAVAGMAAIIETYIR